MVTASKNSNRYSVHSTSNKLGEKVILHQTILKWNYLGIDCEQYIEKLYISDKKFKFFIIAQIEGAGYWHPISLTNNPNASLERLRKCENQQYSFLCDLQALPVETWYRYYNTVSIDKNEDAIE